MSALATGRRRVAGALLYLYAASLLGALRLGLRRLRQPKYVLGALLFLGYFVLVLGGPIVRAQRMRELNWPPEALALIGALVAVPLLAWVLLTWFFPGGRDSLRFSEPEIAFLFPAPVPRVALVHFALLRSQLTIFFSAFLLSLLFGRGRGLPGNALQHATAIWLMFATLRLHGLGAAFTMARLGESRRGWWLRLGASLAALLLLVAAGWWIGLQSPSPPESEAHARVWAAWLLSIRDSTLLGVLLAPFELLTAPLVRGGDGWWRALFAALAVFGLHYFWVLRSHLAFEDAAIDAARKRAARTEARREGRLPSWFRRKARTAPFPLAARGPLPLAFLWSGLIGSGGGFWRPRNVLLAVLATALLVLGLSLTPWAAYLRFVSELALMLYVLASVVAPMVMQRRLRETLDQLDIYKAAPLRGIQIATGQLLTPAALATFFQWYALLVMLSCALFGGVSEVGFGASAWALLAGAILLGPLLTALTLCIPFAWILWFPAWATALGSQGGGFEAAGQRTIFGLAYLLLALLAILPAGLVGLLAYFLGRWFEAGHALAVLFSAILAAGVLLMELAGVLRLLGGRIDRLDVSSELR